MTDNNNSNPALSLALSTLVLNVIEDGTVDATEVQQLGAHLYEDGTIDRAEAEALFQINDACSGNDENDPTWGPFFAKAVTDHVLADDTSPGVVDQDEADWLVSKIQGDGQIDGVEKLLLAEIATRATGTIPANLQALISSATQAA